MMLTGIEGNQNTIELPSYLKIGKIEENGTKIFEGILSGFLTFFIFLVVVIFPLHVQGKEDIKEDKNILLTHIISTV